jgi:hypothetical protein
MMCFNRHPTTQKSFLLMAIVIVEHDFGADGEKKLCREIIHSITSVR